MDWNWWSIFSALWLAVGIWLSILTGFRDNNEDYIYLTMVASIPMPWFLDWYWTAYFLSLALFGVLTWQASRYYLWKYPIYEVEPYRTLSDKYGHQYFLYIREWKGRFIIGMAYEVEADGNLINKRTRWTGVFPDFASAEREALKLSEQYV
jgi:hypothetical protein